MPEFTQKAKRRMPLFLILVLGLSLAVYLAMLHPQQKYYDEHYVKIHGIFFLKPVGVSPFSLMDNHSQIFNQENLQDHWSLLFFGFTHCSNVCPITLATLNKTYQLLQESLPSEMLPQIIFITIDPELDSIERLNNYLGSFNSHFIGARTTIEKTNALEKSFFVTAAKIQGAEKNQYTFDHSAEVILINPNGKIQAYFSYPQQPKQLAEDYRAIINKIKKNQ